MGVAEYHIFRQSQIKLVIYIYSMKRNISITIPSISIFWVNYNELTASSLEIIVSKGNHPQMALIQVSELL